MSLTLDRMALEDVGAEPQRLAEAILAQMQYRSGPVPIEAIAQALGIMEIREEPLTNLEGTLITTPERESGSILVNSNASPRRRRFTVGHELGHFLNPYHVGAEDGGLSCSLGDMRFLSSASADRHRRQESEANRFAIEILAPRTRCQSFLKGDPDICEILSMVREFEISREAAARRYVELNGNAVAVVFTKDRRLTYWVPSDSCPALSVRKGDLLPLPSEPVNTRAPTDMGYVEGSFWLHRPKGELMLQTLFQTQGHAITLLRLIPDDEEEPEIEDAYQRFAKYNERP